MTPQDEAPAVDLRCAACGYDLRGLERLRCPECGAAYPSIEALREAQRPRLAFETARGWSLPLGFAATWFQSLFLPWRFAQAVQTSTNAGALGFALICFATTLLSLLFGSEIGFVAAWVITGGLYIVAQAIALTIIQPERGQRPIGAVFASWLRVGAYTSAIVMTEFAIGPPLFEPPDTLLFLVAPWKAGLASSADLTTAAHWLMLVAWLTSLSFAIAARLRPSWPRAARMTTAIIIAFVGLSHLYSLFVLQIGARIYQWLENAP